MTRNAFDDGGEEWLPAGRLRYNMTVCFAIHSPKCPVTFFISTRIHSQKIPARHLFVKIQQKPGRVH